RRLINYIYSIDLAHYRVMAKMNNLIDTTAQRLNWLQQLVHLIRTIYNYDILTGCRLI
ncbi:hypothetical protein LCGC14_2994070, partial [marine sediment metagenome]